MTLDKRKTINFFDKDIYKSRLNGYLTTGDCFPLDAVIHLNNYCQHKCDFCYNTFILNSSSLKLPKISLNPQFTIKLIEELAEKGTQNILISGGGEPLLHPNKKDILDSLVKLDISSSIYTNLDIEIDNLEKILSKIHNINININTTNKDLYKQTRGKEANVERVKSNISKLLHNGANITATMIIRDNTIDTLEKSIYNLISLGIQSVVVSPAFSLEYNDKIGTNQQSIKKLEHIKNNLIQKKVRILEPEGLTIRDSNGNAMCKSHYFDITIGADYGAYPCCNTTYLSRYKIFDLKKYTNFSEGWKSEERKLWIEKNDINCQTCWFSPINNAIINYKSK